MSNTEILLTVPEVSGLLRITPRHVQNLMGRRILRPVRLGRRVLFLRESVMALLNRIEEDGPMFSSAGNKTDRSGVGFVYVMTDNTGIKIGYAKHSASHRRSILQTGNPRLISIVESFKLDGAIKIEAAMRQKYRHALKRRRGEWYHKNCLEEVLNDLREIREQQADTTD